MGELRALLKENQRLVITVENLEQCLYILKAFAERNIECSVLINHVYTGSRTLILYVEKNNRLELTSHVPPVNGAKSFNTFNEEELDRIIMEQYL